MTFGTRRLQDKTHLGLMAPPLYCTRPTRMAAFRLGVVSVRTPSGAEGHVSRMQLSSDESGKPAISLAPPELLLL